MVIRTNRQTDSSIYILRVNSNEPQTALSLTVFPLKNISKWSFKDEGTACLTLCITGNMFSFTNWKISEYIRCMQQHWQIVPYKKAHKIAPHGITNHRLWGSYSVSSLDRLSWSFWEGCPRAARRSTMRLRSRTCHQIVKRVLFSERVAALSDCYLNLKCKSRKLKD